MMPYVVQKTEGDMTAWLSIPGADSSRAEFLNDRAQATEFHLKATAELWAWDLGATVVSVEEEEEA